MAFKTLAFALAFSSAVSAAPALQARQSDPCQDAYKQCIAAGTAEVACSCTLTACLGEDNARNREYCSSATANLAQPTTTTYACNPAHSYPNGASCVSTNGALSLVTSAPSASTTGYACNPAHSYPNGASCVSTNGALSLVTSASSASSTTYACNPAHSYPNGASCVSTNGALSLVTSAASASTTAYACNPAHSYPNGANCVSTNGALSLVTSAPSASTTAYACNPAHSYPNGASCVSTDGALSLVTPAPSSSTAYACNPAHSYPNGASCVSTNGALSLVTPAPSAASSAVSSAVSAAATAASVAAPGSNPVKVDGKTWSIDNLSRYCGDDNTGCDYNFDLAANGNTQHCTVIRMPGSNAAIESWSNQNCTDGSDIKLSWGYVTDPAPAFAVLTVVEGKELAWFGVSDVNGQKVSASSPFGSGSYGNLTSQQVYMYN